MHDDSLSMSLSNNSNNHLSTANDFENLNGDDDAHAHAHQTTQKALNSLVDIDCYDPSSSSLLDPQLAAYRAIMSRMIPFANHINGNNPSPQRTSSLATAASASAVKQEPLNNADESSQDNESNDSSPIHDQASP